MLFRSIYLNTVCKQELDGFSASKIGDKDAAGNVIGDNSKEIEEVTTVEIAAKA